MTAEAREMNQIAARLEEARKLIQIAKKELQESEVEVMRKDAQLVAARDNFRFVQAQIMEENEPSFKKMTDAIQTIQMYAIMNGISLGDTMDALTEKLFSQNKTN
jgi:transketolase